MSAKSEAKPPMGSTEEWGSCPYHSLNNAGRVLKRKLSRRRSVALTIQAPFQNVTKSCPSVGGAENALMLKILVCWLKWVEGAASPADITFEIAAAAVAKSIFCFTSTLTGSPINVRFHSCINNSTTWLQNEGHSLRMGLCRLLQ